MTLNTVRSKAPHLCSTGNIQVSNFNRFWVIRALVLKWPVTENGLPIEQNGLRFGILVHQDNMYRVPLTC